MIQFLPICQISVMFLDKLRIDNILKGSMKDDNPPYLFDNLGMVECLHRICLKAYMNVRNQQK